MLVTGADGFVGKHLCHALRCAGDEVFEIRGPSRSPTIEKIWSVDIGDAHALAEIVSTARPEGVIHLAGASSVAQSHKAPAETFAVNAIGTVNVLQAVRDKAPEARVVTVGSGEVYGPLAADERATEESPLAPTSPYAASKAAAELAGFQFFRSYGLAVISARSFNHLGAGQAPNFVVPSFARQLAAIHRAAAGSLSVGNLESVRDFSHVDDVVDAYRLLLVAGKPGEAYNVCSGIGRSIRSLLDELVVLSGKKTRVEVDPSRFRPGDIARLVGDSSKLRALGWSPIRTITDALRQALDEALEATTDQSNWPK